MRRKLPHLKLWLAASAMMIFAAPAWADTPNGQTIFLHGNGNGAMPCAACHGQDGAGNSAIGAPKLAGLPAVAVKSYLAKFANGDGGNATMQYIAQALAPAETDAVANYISSLK
ncbi:MAG TPA: c-type cytochrome [Acetobacteraceae bacterium]|nr:c-type cytochrome [Acetobacteraceae bacterium]HQU04154.1 c-type cytochrome [Acidocella sp.]